MKFIHFKSDRVKSDELSVHNHKGTFLGWIEFQGEWKTDKQFIFCPANDVFFTEGCLREIVEKLQEMNMFEQYSATSDS
jgi:hypothetical protein